ncbi:hypothetical protein ACE1SV_63780 [Streptomyces sennicomposti]
MDGQPSDGADWGGVHAIIGSAVHAFDRTATCRRPLLSVSFDGADSAKGSKGRLGVTPLGIVLHMRGVEGSSRQMVTHQAGSANGLKVDLLGPRTMAG